MENSQQHLPKKSLYPLSSCERVFALFLLKCVVGLRKSSWPRSCRGIVVTVQKGGRLRSRDVSLGFPRGCQLVWAPAHCTQTRAGRSKPLLRKPAALPSAHCGCHAVMASLLRGPWNRRWEALGSLVLFPLALHSSHGRRAPRPPDTGPARWSLGFRAGGLIF